MQIELDSDLSEQLADCKEGEAITLSGTLTTNKDGAAVVDIDTAQSQEAEETGEDNTGGAENEETAGMPMGAGMAGAPNIPGPVRKILSRR